jgi:eukaryotic-like serine/threonine-protein kinase
MRLGTPPPQDRAAPAVPLESSPRTIRSFGDYELLQEIARGGMGLVYRARQVSLNRMVAVKVLLGGQFANETFARRFRREAQAAASLTHPNIVSIYEVGGHDGQPYFSMELVEGRSLAELTREKPLPARQAAQLVKTIAEAVHYAHERGVLHRDLKPSNVLVDASGAPHITDFGLAKQFAAADVSKLTSESKAQTPNSSIDQSLASAATEDLTITGQVLGTPNYMPPEQADPRHAPTAATSDVYSLGAILYHLLTGRPPFMAETLTQTLRLVSESEPVSPRLLNPNVARDLETICIRCLEKDPQRRYASAQELADELDRLLRDEPIRARPVGWAGRTARWCRRKPALAVALGAAAALLLIVAIGSPIAIVRINRARKAAETARNQEAALRLRAESAERQTQQQLFNALLEQARATVRSRELGQRVRALDALQRAAAISNSIELRREVFAALALPDLRLERESPYGSGFTLREPDSTFERIALARGTGPVEVRAVSDQRLLATFPASTNLPAHDAEWSPDGRFLAVKRDYRPDGARADWEVWDVPGARRIFVLHDIPVGAVAFHPTLPRLIFGIRPAAVVVRSLDDGREIAQFPVAALPYLLRYVPSGERFAAAYSSNSARAATYPSEASLGLSVYDATTGTRIASMVCPAFVRDFQWHPGGQWLAVPDDSGAVNSMDARTGETRVLGRHKLQAVSVTFSPEGGWLLSGGWDGELICWDARAMRRAFSMGLESSVARFRADGRACAVMRASGIQWYDFERPVGYREFAEDLGSRLRHAAFSADGRWLAVSAEKRAGVWDLSGEGPPALRDEMRDAFFFFTPDGSELLASRTRDRDGDCFRWRLAPAKKPGEPPDISRLPLHKPAGFTSMALHSNSIVFTSTNGSQVLAREQWETGSDRWTRISTGAKRVSPDGRWLVIYRSFTPSVSVHRMPGMEFVARLSHPANVGGFEFSPRGKEMAVYSSRIIELWNTETWQQTRTMTNFRRLLYASDAHTVWLERNARTAGLHDARTLEPLLLLPTGMLPVAESADGRQLAVKVDADRLQVWDLEEVRKQLRELGLEWSEEQSAVRAAKR